MAVEPRILEVDMGEYDIITITNTVDGNKIPALDICVLEHNGQPVTLAMQLNVGANFKGLPVAISWRGGMTKPVLAKTVW